MVLIKKWQFWMSMLLVTAVLTVIAATSAFSQQQADTINLGISPQVIEVSANPGDVVENQIRLTNGGELPVVIEVIPKNFLPSGEEGAVDLTEDSTSYSLAEWIAVTPSSVVIPAKKTQDFDIVITVPNNAEPGGHFGSVVFKTVPPPGGESQAAEVSQEIAPVILVSVAGDVDEVASIESFMSSKNFWSNERPITFETRIRNEGNVHFKPSGTITIKNMFGQEVTTIVLEEKNVLPDSVRRIVSEWSDPGFAIGRYTADLTVVYGEDDTILTDSTSFIVFPYQTIVPAVLLIGLIVFVLIKFRSRIGAAGKVLSGRN